MKINKAKNVRLVVQPVIGIMVHEHVSVGTDHPVELQGQSFSGAEAAGTLKNVAFRENLKKYIEPEQDFEMLEPVSYEITESFEVTEAMMAELMKNDAKTDVYLFISIGRTNPMVLELATRTKKPFICLQECCDKTQVPAMLRSRGLEYVSEMTWEETVEKKKAYRLRKVLQKSPLLLLDSWPYKLCTGFRL